MKKTLTWSQVLANGNQERTGITAASTIASENQLLAKLEQYKSDYTSSRDQENILKRYLLTVFKGQEEILSQICVFETGMKNNIFGIAGLSSSTGVYASNNASQQLESYLDLFCAHILSNPGVPQRKYCLFLDGHSFMMELSADENGDKYVVIMDAAGDDAYKIMSVIPLLLDRGFNIYYGLCTYGSDKPEYRGVKQYLAMQTDMSSCDAFALYFLVTAVKQERSIISIIRAQDDFVDNSALRVAVDSKLRFYQEKTFERELYIPSMLKLGWLEEGECAGVYKKGAKNLINYFDISILPKEFLLAAQSTRLLRAYDVLTMLDSNHLVDGKNIFINVFENKTITRASYKRLDLDEYSASELIWLFCEPRIYCAYLDQIATRQARMRAGLFVEDFQIRHFASPRIL